MVETVLRQLNLELLRQLWVGQDAVRRSVAKASSESSLDSSISSNSETPSYQETCSTSSRTYCPRDPLDAFQTDPRDMTRPGLSRAASLPPAKSQHQQYLGRPRPHSAPLPTTSDLNDPEPVAGLNDLGLQKAQVLRSLEARQSKPSKPRVTFCEEQSEEESVVPEKSWRLRPYLGYDWIAGSLDNTSPVTSKPDAFFSKLQKFRESNEEECVYSRPRSQLLGLHEGTVVEDDHECVYCYRVNRRLFLVPVDPGTPCRLCRTSRDQQGPKTLKEPAQVRVSIPLSILDPPHRYRVHRRKSFDASDTLALPRHCLLGWDILPPKSERSSAPKSLDLWSSVSKAQHFRLSASSPSRLVWFQSRQTWGAPGRDRYLGTGTAESPGEQESGRAGLEASLQGPIPPALTLSFFWDSQLLLPALLHPFQESDPDSGPGGDEAEMGQGAPRWPPDISLFTIQALPVRGPPPTPIWSEPQVPGPCAPRQKP